MAFKLQCIFISGEQLVFELDKSVIDYFYVNYVMNCYISRIQDIVLRLQCTLYHFQPTNQYRT